jgi:hypothetical protein
MLQPTCARRVVLPFDSHARAERVKVSRFVVGSSIIDPPLTMWVCANT